MQTAAALIVTLVSACALNVGYLIEHSVASRLPPLSAGRPLRSARMLLSQRRWLAGFATEAAGWLLYVAALSLAPLSLVQATAAGGIGILAIMVSHNGEQEREAVALFAELLLAAARRRSTAAAEASADAIRDRGKSGPPPIA